MHDGYTKLGSFIALVLTAAGSCTGMVTDERGSAPPSEVTPAAELLLAAVPALPLASANAAGPHTVAAVDNYLNGDQAWNTSTAGAVVDGTTMALDSTATTVAWALYQWSGIGPADPPVQFVVETDAAGQHDYWVVLSDFASGTWQVHGPLRGSVAALDYVTGADYASAGSTYAGVLATGGHQLAISRVNLVLEGGGGTVLFEEPFEDEDYQSRGWYDNPGFGLTTDEHAPGSTRAVEFHFEPGATGPTVRGGRVLIEETDSVYVSFHVKYSANWTGSDRPYHPHEFHFVTTENSKWVGPAYTHLTTYIEHNEGVPLLAIQDAENIDESRVGEDLSDVTESRSVAGCNGSTDGYPDDCYWAGETHRNGKQWRAAEVYFADEPGPRYKNDWHFIEAYFKLNSIIEGKGVTDGVVRYWYDGELIIDHEDVLLRTGQHPDMLFNQFLVLPYIGDGSPVDQTMWLDNLTIATARP